MKTHNTMEKDFTIRNKREVMISGLRAGIPIGLGYLAVSFSLGIAAKNAGLNALQSFLTSLLCNASAGEYAGFTLIAAGATYLEIALMTFVANARYLLMSCAMSQKAHPGMPGGHRALLSFFITDEFFALAVTRPGSLNPFYVYGAVLAAAPCWSVGTALGCIAGNLLPARLVSAFSVALYGMFLAVIIPPARKSKLIAGVICVCFALSFASAYLPGISAISGGTRTILLTLVISSAAALLFPRESEEEESVGKTDKRHTEEKTQLEK